MGCWPGLITERYLPHRLYSHQRQIPRGTLNSTTRVAYRANGLVNSVSNIIVKHQHGLVTDCHHLPMVPIVPQSAPMVSVADVSSGVAMAGSAGSRNLGPRPLGAPTDRESRKTSCEHMS